MWSPHCRVEYFRKERLCFEFKTFSRHCHTLEKGKGSLFQMEGLVKQMTLTEP